MLADVLKRKPFLLVLLLVGLGLLGFGLYGLWQFWPKTTSPPEMVTVTTSTDQPSEDNIDPNANYQVPADQPRRIMLPTIETEGFVQRVGIDQHGAVAVPTNIHLAGWYTTSAKPGDIGVSLIDGHLQGQYRPAIFKRLHELKAGDRFMIEFGDHSQRQFEVVSVATYTVADAGEHMLQQDQSVQRQLNLITCGGRYDPKSQQYDKRVLVVSRTVE